MNLGETIYQYRVSKNFSQGDLANMLDVSRQSVSKWENNSAVPDLIYLYIFEDAAPIAITFTMGENDSVNANGSFVLFDELDALSTQELLEYLGVFSVEVDIVSE